MNEHDRLPPDIEDLLRERREVGRAPDAAKERSRLRLAALLGPVGGLGGGLGGGEGGQGGGPSTAPGGAPPAGAAPGAGKVAGAFAGKATLVKIAGGVVLTAAVGASVQATREPPPPAPVTATATIAPTATATVVAAPASAEGVASAPVQPASSAMPIPSARPRRHATTAAAPDDRPKNEVPPAAGGKSEAPSALREPAPEARPSAPPAVTDTLAEEKRLVDEARAAFARGALHEAEAILSAHARRFSNGQLAPERDALVIRVLVADGRTAEATAKARQFRLDYPGDRRALPVP
ncbi:MAG TPA: hypothetical protein VM925_22615 [Labilithrix sp.]|nr:hypothetical protein [Labilithrix sp.]